MDQAKVMELFKKTDAFLSGHFELSSGLHSDAYVQCALVLQYPPYAAQLAEGVAAYFKGQRVTCVIGPALGGVTFAYEIARVLGVRGIFAERKDGVMSLRRGFSLTNEDRVVVVEDVITTGGSVKEVIALVEHSGATVVGVGSVADRGTEPASFSYPFHALMRMPLNAYQPAACPLCARGMALTKPGSKSLKK